MDIYCPTCAEPFDHDELHSVAEESGSTYAIVSADFRKRGCKAFEAAYGPQTHCVPAENKGQANMIAEVYGLLGDDMDGAASMLDDARYMGLL
jgi:hypothetical protein